MESARVEGKPRIVSQEYLGSAEEVVAKLTGASSGEPVRSQHKKFGDLAAVWAMLERLGVRDVVDEVAPRYANAAASVGTYIALACANRIVEPMKCASMCVTPYPAHVSTLEQRSLFRYRTRREMR